MRSVAILLLLFAGGLAAQSPGNGTGQVAQSAMAPKALIWRIPFASTENTISLSIQNNSTLEAKGVSVTFNNLPTWIEFKSNAILLKSIPTNGSSDAEFTFSVDKKAPVGRDTTLTATISSADGQVWTRDITVSVGAPKDYKLYNNFPNPFNPSTKIAFELPKASHVRPIIYDVVGREVAQIADGDYPAGYSELTWNGLNRNGEQVSSGVYLYRISADKWNKVMKMLSLK